MKKLAKYLFLAALATFAFASCQKTKEDEQPAQVKYTFTAAATSATEAELKVVADNAVSADVTVKLALDAASTLKDGVTFPAELVLAKGKTEVTGKLTVDMSALPKDGNKYTAIIAATVDGKAIGTAEAISVTTEKGGVPPTPSGPAVDGVFDDWNDIEGIEGTGALQLFKMQSDDTKMYFYMEVDKSNVLDGNLAYAHKVMLCFDNGDFVGENSVLDVWNDYGFDKIVDIWMMQGGVPNMVTWGLDGFAHKEVDGDIQKYEFCFNKSIDPVFSGAMMRYGAFINTQNCDTSTGAEVWSGDANEGIGFAPAASENMATIGDVPAPPAIPGMIVIDGDPSDWEGVENVVTMECPEGAEMTGLLSAKILYGKKLYIMAKISDEAIADGKVRMHVYFDTDETGGVTQHWNEANIDYMTEGKITNSGAYVDYSSSLYKWDGTPEEPWKWAACEDNLSYKGAGKDNIYELAINYSKYPGGLPEEFSIGLDVVNSSWAVFGYLPQTYYKLVIKKDGIAEQPVEPQQQLGEFDSNVTAFSNLTSSYTDNVVNVTLGEETFNEVFNVKFGTSSKFGSATATLPAGTKSLSFYAVAWKAKPASLKFTVGEKEYKFDVTANDGAANNSPYGITVTASDKYAFNLDAALAADTEFKVETFEGTNNGTRVFLFGIQASEDEADVPAPAGGITLDGNFDDWANVDAQTPFAAIKEWKVSRNADYLCFYFKIARDGIKAGKTEDETGKFPFDRRRYMAMVFDMDNNAETGTTTSYAGVNNPEKETSSLPGDEAWAIVYPFRGYSDTKEGKEGELLIVNGTDALGGAALIAEGDGSPEEAANKVANVAFGHADATVSDGFAYFEVGVPLSGLGNPAAGTTIKFMLSFSWDLNAPVTFTL